VQRKPLRALRTSEILNQRSPCPACRHPFRHRSEGVDRRNQSQPTAALFALLLPHRPTSLVHFALGAHILDRHEE